MPESPTAALRPVDTTAPPGAIPLLGFGTWQAQGDDAYRSVRDALDVGYRHIDTATMYHNHAQVGRKFPCIRPRAGQVGRAPLSHPVRLL